LYYQTKSLWTPIALHAMNNTIASLSLLKSDDPKGSAAPDQLEAVFGRGWIGIILLIMALPWVMRFVAKNWPRKDALTPYQANQIVTEINLESV
jgi:uncharacterized protein